MIDDKRCKVRLKFPVVIQVTTRYDEQFTGVVRDIGIESLYLYVDEERQPEKGEQVKMRMILLGEDSRLIIETSGVVVRIDNLGFAVRFNKPLEWWPVFSLFPQHKLGSSMNGQGGGRR